MNLTIALPETEGVELCISFFSNVITDVKFSSNLKTKSADISSGEMSNKVFMSDSELFQHDLSFAKKIELEFKTYFVNPEYRFSLCCQLEQGTPFQQKVWQALTRIPVGQVKTYGALAKELKSSPRAVGNACRKNPFPVLVPCHRVVSASGIGGYAGDTQMSQKGAINHLQIKQWLLAHEKEYSQ